MMLQVDRPHWRDIKRIRLYFHSKEICAYTQDAPNKECFFNASISSAAT